MSTSSAVSATVSRDVNVLRKHLQLSQVPLEAAFEQVPVGGHPGGLGPTDYVLVALMRFDPAGLQTLINHASPLPKAASRILKDIDRDWFPPTVRAAVSPHDATTLNVRGRAFDAATLVKPPYSSGYLITVDSTGYVIVVLETK